MNNTDQGAQMEVLPRPFALAPHMQGQNPSPAVVDLVESQVNALLSASPAFHGMPHHEQAEMKRNMIKIASYSAALTQEEFAQSEKLGQRPLLQTTEVLTPLLGTHRVPSAQSVAPARSYASKGPAADEFSPRAASQIAQITKDTLKAISFPTFVADLIKGTYSAIIDASIKQMDSYAALLKNVAGTVEQFMADNISDNQGRDFLAGSHPDIFKVDTTGGKPKLTVRDNADEKQKPDFQRLYGVGDVDLSDDAAVEDTLVPAARRSLAKQRQQVLSTMVMMGINRIVITSGTLKAAMKFHIDTTDTAKAKSASEFDEKNETTASLGGGMFSFFGGGSVETKNTVTYVSTESKEANDTINTSADLSSSVEIKFKSDYFPMEKLATPEMLAAIQGNTSNPAANKPPAAAGAPAPAAPAPAH